MISRRQFIGSSIATCCSVPAIADAAVQSNGAAPAKGSESAAKGESVLKYVKPRIATGGHGHTYPGASVPFGMVQLSPDTFISGWDWCSGYNYGDTSLMGFSHTHLSGTGIGDMLDVLVMPGTGFVYTEPGSRDTPERGYRSRFSHDHEVMEPGYYSVQLRDARVFAELTATARAGVHRYTFPETDSAHIIVDFSHSYKAGGERQQSVRWSNLQVIGRDTIVGGRSVNQWANGREIYFAMKFSRPFDRVEILNGDTPAANGETKLEGTALKALAHYKTAEGERILVKTALSGVSIEGAMKNLDGEVPAWDFDGTRAAAAKLWEDALSRIQVHGGTDRQKEIFYTALYHCHLAPTLFCDLDGKYKGMDRTVHELKPGERNYSTFSLWDTYRGVHPLFTLVQPELVPGMANCLVRMAHESPAGMPVWPLQAIETACMTGYHSVAVIAEAINKGFSGIDVAAAYAAMRQRAMTDDYQGLALYRELGYIPCDKERESIGKGLDYAYDDWAIAHVARAAGQEEDARQLTERAGNYKNFFDSSTGFMRPKLATGAWAEPFTPAEIGHAPRWRDYTESNAWQATFAVQHDPEGLARLLGGREKLAEKLDALFSADPTLPADAPVDIAGLVGQYAHGNEPSHHIAYLYAYAGQPHKTQQRVSSLLETMYENEPDGIAGNEDCGQMSAWYVLSALGFYSVDPVSTNYIVGSPVFDRASINLGEGKKLDIELKRPSPHATFINRVLLNGKSLDRAWFSHHEIAAGGHLVLECGERPDPNFGSKPESLPPSRTPVSAA